MDCLIPDSRGLLVPSWNARLASMLAKYLFTAAMVLSLIAFSSVWLVIIWSKSQHLGGAPK